MGAACGVQLAGDDGFAALGDLVLGGLLGAALGEPLGLACGVHLANGRRGNAKYGAVASFLPAVVGVGVALAAKEEKVLIAIPLVQLVTTVVTERTTAARGDYKAVGWCPPRL